MRTVFDAKGDAGVRVVGADAQYAPVGRGTGVVVSTCMQRRAGRRGEHALRVRMPLGNLVELDDGVARGHQHTLGRGETDVVPDMRTRRDEHLPAKAGHQWQSAPLDAAKGCRTITCRDEGGNQRPSEAIRGHQRPSEAIRGHQRPSELNRGKGMSLR
jgi:hypothetical protein